MNELNLAWLRANRGWAEGTTHWMVWDSDNLLGQLVSINPPMSTLCLSPNMSYSTRSCPEWQLHVWQTRVEDYPPVSSGNLAWQLKITYRFNVKIVCEFHCHVWLRRIIVCSNAYYCGKWKHVPVLAAIGGVLNQAGGSWEIMNDLRLSGLKAPENLPSSPVAQPTLPESDFYFGQSFTVRR